MLTSEKTICHVLNQLHTLQMRCESKIDKDRMRRQFERIYRSFEDLGYFIKNPIGEDYNLMRLDCEASIAGDSSDDLKIVEVIKPIIYFRRERENRIVQPGVVIASSQK